VKFAEQDKVQDQISALKWRCLWQDFSGKICNLTGSLAS
jgi:hypothetical protein